VTEQAYTAAIIVGIGVAFPAALLLLLKCGEAVQNLRQPKRPFPQQRPMPGTPQPPMPKPGPQPGDVVVSGSKWEKKLKHLFDAANAAGDAQRTAFVAAYIAYVPNLLQQIGAPDLAAAIQIRFFRPQAPPQPTPPGSGQATKVPPGQANGSPKPALVPPAPT
jgi:hypothetical protein